MNQIATGPFVQIDIRALDVPFPRWTSMEAWRVRNGQDWAEIAVGHGVDDLGCPWTSISAFSSQGHFAYGFPEPERRDWRWRTEEMQRDETLRFMAGADGMVLDFEQTVANLHERLAIREVASFADHIRLRQAEELARAALRPGRESEAADRLLAPLSDLVPDRREVEDWGPGPRTRAFRDRLWHPFCEEMQLDVHAGWKTRPPRRPDAPEVVRQEGHDWMRMAGGLVPAAEPLPVPPAHAFHDDPALALAL